jgi:hypothetical protein
LRFRFGGRVRDSEEIQREKGALDNVEELCGLVGKMEHGGVEGLGELGMELGVQREHIQ